MMSICPDLFEFLIDPFGKLKRVQMISEGLQFQELSLIGKIKTQETIQRRLRLVISPGSSRSFPHHSLPFHRRLEKVHPQPELICIKGIHRIKRGQGVIAIPTDELTDMSPVLLLDMGVIEIGRASWMAIV